MFQNDYRREMDGLRPSPAAVERLNRLLEEGAPARRSRRLGRRAAAALALCAALCVAWGPPPPWPQRWRGKRPARASGWSW